MEALPDTVLRAKAADGPLRRPLFTPHNWKVLALGLNQGVGN